MNTLQSTLFTLFTHSHGWLSRWIDKFRRSFRCKVWWKNTRNIYLGFLSLVSYLLEFVLEHCLLQVIFGVDTFKIWTQDLWLRVKQSHYCTWRRNCWPRKILSHHNYYYSHESPQSLQTLVSFQFRVRLLFGINQRRSQ